MVKATTKQPAKREENALARRGEFAPSPWVSRFAFMRRFSAEMDRLFEGLVGGRGGMTPFFGRTAEWTPDVDVVEREGSIVVRADVPGLTKKDLKVEVTDEALTIEGERAEDHEEKRQGYYRSERSYGRFSRSIPLPEGVKAEEAKASFRNGVLEVVIPAPGRAVSRGRRLEIDEG